MEIFWRCFRRWRHYECEPKNFFWIFHFIHFAIIIRIAKSFSTKFMSPSYESSIDKDEILILRSEPVILHFSLSTIISIPMRFMVVIYKLLVISMRIYIENIFVCFRNRGAQKQIIKKHSQFYANQMKIFS